MWLLLFPVGRGYQYCVVLLGRCVLHYSAVVRVCICTVAVLVAGFWVVCACLCLFVLFWLLFKSCAATLQNGWTALYIAACGGHTAAVEVLVAAGADMNIGDNVSLTTSVVIVAHAVSGFHTGICCWVGGGGRSDVKAHTHAGFSRHTM